MDLILGRGIPVTAETFPKGYSFTNSLYSAKQKVCWLIKLSSIKLFSISWLAMPRARQPSVPGRGFKYKWLLAPDSFFLTSIVINFTPLSTALFI
jgi:hypothetical protein